jgi:hypothetical protein
MDATRGASGLYRHRGKRPPHNGRGTSMIGRLIGFSARNQLLVLLATLMLTGFGVWSLVNTPLAL